MKYKITILGAGNMGSVLAAKFSQMQSVCVFLNEVESSTPFSKNIEVFCDDTNSSYKANIELITNNLKEAIEFADIIVITYPAFLFKKYADLIIPLLRKGQHILFAPGSGGAEIFFKGAIEKGVTISGLQRVHSVARLIERGVSVRESGIRKQLYVASIPQSFNDEAIKILTDLYSIPVIGLDNYLNVTLINSNPILHTSRLYSIFKDFPNEVSGYEKVPLFYEDWNLKSSDLLIKMDSELFALFKKLSTYGIEVKQVKSLLEHYESSDDVSLTNKITSIKSLKGLTTPSVKNEKGLFVPDLNSRYFTADFPFGLDILISFFDFFGLECESMKKVSLWYHKVLNDNIDFNLYNYFVDVKSLVDYYGK